MWYIGPDKLECGAPAVTDVTVKTRVTQAVVTLCAKHKAIHDENWARARNSPKAS
jgi:phage tail sheath gpL-like